ncbi:hypothetical protein M0811_06199 [Anaeramoeba ignava]|uniref:Uncharacterized protein n=1 Tax=Anaeramoeba ignava TaxID=1746090 RepID=A0A9Q0RFC8_ANAIG|nr:hypothetical protein M0811_06199 [Anaeramoeba ignava]
MIYRLLKTNSIRIFGWKKINQIIKKKKHFLYVLFQKKMGKEIKMLYEIDFTFSEQKNKFNPIHSLVSATVCFLIRNTHSIRRFREFFKK